MPRLGEVVRAGKPGETAADDDRVVRFLNAEKRISCVHLSIKVEECEKSPEL